MLSTEDMHRRMAEGWEAGKPYTVCGNGSLPKYTANIRQALPEWWAKYSIQSVNDAGAGDLQWLAGMALPVLYRAFDLIPRHPSVVQWDITDKTLPPADMVLCRMVLNHLDDDRVQMALDRFSESSRYLAATQFDGGGPQRSPQYRRLDLTRWLGQPVESVQDGAEDACRLALWRV